MIRRICSRKEDFLQRTPELKRFLIYQGYNDNEVQQKINKTMSVDSDVLLLIKKLKMLLERVLLIVTYHPSFPLLKNILEKHSSILTVLEKLNQGMRTPPLVAYRHPPNLKSLLVRSIFKPRLMSYKGYPSVNNHAVRRATIQKHWKHVIAQSLGYIQCNSHGHL